MRITAVFLFLVSATLLFFLVKLRITEPEAVVNTGLGFTLSMLWSAMLYLGLASWIRLDIGSRSVGKPLTLSSTFITSFATCYLLDVGYFTKSQNQIEDQLFFIVSFTVLFFWWIYVWKKIKKHEEGLTRGKS